jgi:secondary thiamine-phosphate synthase enzyme
VYGCFPSVGARYRAAMETTVLELDTAGSRIVDVTREVADFCRDLGDGLVNVFAPHATAGLALMETGSGSEEDLAATLDQLLPRDDRYRHRHGSPGHGADHLLPALVSPSLSVPVQSGRMLLGTWQSVVLVDTNADNRRRQVRLTFIPA